MGAFFSSKKRSDKKNENNDDVITTKDKAILDLKNARDKLKKYRKKVCSLFIFDVVYKSSIQ